MMTNRALPVIEQICNVSSIVGLADYIIADDVCLSKGIIGPLLQYPRETGVVMRIEQVLSDSTVMIFLNTDAVVIIFICRYIPVGTICCCPDLFKAILKIICVNRFINKVIVRVRLIFISGYLLG